MLFPFGAFHSAPSGKVRSLGAPREPSRAGGLGRSRQGQPVTLVARGQEPGHGRWGVGRAGAGRAGRRRGAAGGRRRGGLGPFPFGTASFALFGPEVQVVSATKRRSFGELKATKRRQVRRRFVTSSPFRRLFGPGSFSSALYARRGFSRPGFSALLRESPLRRFVPQKSCGPVGFPLRRRAASPWRSSAVRRAKVRQPGRFSVSP